MATGNLWNFQMAKQRKMIISFFDNSNTIINQKNSDIYLEHMKSYGSLKNGVLHSEKNKQIPFPVSACNCIKTLGRRKLFWHIFTICLVSFHAYTNSVANIWGSVKQPLMAYPQNRGKRIQDTIELEEQYKLPFWKAQPRFKCCFCKYLKSTFRKK